MQGAVGWNATPVRIVPRPAIESTTPRVAVLMTYTPLKSVNAKRRFPSGDRPMVRMLPAGTAAVPTAWFVATST